MLRRAALGLCVVLSVCSMIPPVFAQGQKTGKVVRLGIICGARCEGAGYDALKEELRRLGWIEG